MRIHDWTELSTSTFKYKKRLIILKFHSQIFFVGELSVNSSEI